ncbi:FAD-binding oxidoreductase [Thalassospira sp. TSL5-1]|uniref:NAD(P)/FAD-dependent oxidoreductase n=1 Tax=Thalassospira sp. TSL5-1 TaxID=1544451 RepID=UPI00093C3026|nr:FAD-binding oxidoreductase [Thalassospira sp. TSL5-1]
MPTQNIPEQADIVIIGGGIQGAASAYYLQKAGMSVVLLEKDTIASHQSGRAWGFVRQQGRDPVELPLMKACIAIWPELERELGADLEWRQGGVLYVANNDAEMASYERWLADVKPYDIGSRTLGRAEVEKLMPGLAAPGVGGLFTANDGQAEPKKAAPALALKAHALGAVIVQGCGAVDIETEAGQVSGVMSERGVIKTRIVICAAGAMTHKFVAKFGRRLPQQTTRSTVIRTSPIPPISAVSALIEGLGFRQRADGSLNLADDVNSDIDLTLSRFKYAGDFWPAYKDNWRNFNFHLGIRFIDDLADHLPGSPAADKPLMGRRQTTALPNPKRVRNALAAFKHLFPDAETPKIVDQWAGDIDVTPDAVPVIDQLENPAGFFVATGFSGHGFAMGPIVGRVLSEWITKGAPSINLDDFRLNRFETGEKRLPYSVL